MLIVKNHITAGFSANDAETLSIVIQKCLDEEKIIELEKVFTIDFSEIKIFTTLFFNTILAKYIIEIGPEKYDKIFNLTNLSDLGTSTYNHSISNAKDYYSLDEKQRENKNRIISNID